MSQPLPAHVAAAGIEALRSGWLTMGPRTKKLEEALAARFGVEHAVATSSGTAALHLTLLAAGTERGGCVLVPDLGPPSCAGAVEAVGALAATYPVEGLDPGPAALDVVRGTDARAAVVRHHLGYPADLAELAELCRDRGMTLIEDCREALGALGPETSAGAEGSAAILSFSAKRVVSCGQGGAVLTADGDLAERVRSLRSHAMTSGSWDRHRGHAETYDVIGVGFNYRIDEIRAAMCEAALEDLHERVEGRRERAAEVARAARELGATTPSDELIARGSPEAVPMLAGAADGRDVLVAGLAGAAITAAPVGAERLVVAELGEASR